MSVDAKQQSRWKFLVGGVAVALVVRVNNFVSTNEAASAEVIGSFFGATLGGILFGWVVWWAWAKATK
jgi:hypothetical protein